MARHSLAAVDTRELAPTYTWDDATAAGLTRAQLRDDGVRVTRGAYVSRSLTLSVGAASRGALAVLPAGTVVSHSTAAVLLGAPVPPGWPLEFAVPPRVTPPRRRRIRVHVRDLTPDDVVVTDGIPTTSGAQTWLDLAAILSSAELVAVGDALWRAGHLDTTRLGARLDRATGVRGIRQARRCAPLLTPLAASRPESLVRYWVVEAGLPVPTPQCPVHDRHGAVVAHGDLGWPEWKVLLEYEGRQHAARDQFDRDVDRYSLMAADGWLVVRISRGHLGRRDLVVERVSRTLRSRGASW